jgi:hypothetical protein
LVALKVALKEIYLVVQMVEFFFGMKGTRLASLMEYYSANMKENELAVVMAAMLERLKARTETGKLVLT